VRDEPGLRWLLGTPEPVPLADILDARGRLDLWEATQLRVSGALTERTGRPDAG
jgi:hypothetical protein